MGTETMRYIYVSMYLCIYVCMYVRMHTCTCLMYRRHLAQDFVCSGSFAQIAVMPPKQKTIAKLGTLELIGQGGRVKVKIGQQLCNGPIRTTRVAAQADLDAARQCTSREEMLTFLTTLSQQVPQP